MPWRKFRNLPVSWRWCECLRTVALSKINSSGSFWCKVGFCQNTPLSSSCIYPNNHKVYLKMVLVFNTIFTLLRLGPFGTVVFIGGIVVLCVGALAFVGLCCHIKCFLLIVSYKNIYHSNAHETASTFVWFSLFAFYYGPLNRCLMLIFSCGSPTVLCSTPLLLEFCSLHMLSCWSYTSRGKIWYVPSRYFFFSRFFVVLTIFVCSFFGAYILIMITTDDSHVY